LLETLAFAAGPFFSADLLQHAVVFAQVAVFGFALDVNIKVLPSLVLGYPKRREAIKASLHKTGYTFAFVL
jgi:hypothetical protein